MKVEFDICGPWLVKNEFENEYVTSTVIQELPQRLLAFDELSKSRSIVHFNRRSRSGAQKPDSYPLFKTYIVVINTPSSFARCMNHLMNLFAYTIQSCKGEKTENFIYLT